MPSPVASLLMLKGEVARVLPFGVSPPLSAIFNKVSGVRDGVCEVRLFEGGG